ncbi:hypothetical protein [Streptomyces microflavus]|uniref:hypothetical protein n=1 Tax=Streptomyces microflavus TaxID=1919 RepID=UPI003864A5C0|nr:hypothetical protein OG269_24815 [Streptomyces microflavus]WST15022.1 hypothetical protein OG721_13965 [Streptomyces microflavus]
MHAPIPLLEQLREFDGSVDDYYAAAFELIPFGKDDGGWDPCPANPAFRSWLRDRLGLEAAEDPNEIVRAAGDELWDPFAAWIGPLIPDALSSRRSA